MDKSQLLAEINEARDAIRIAETELEAAIRDIPVAPRSAKTKISEVVQDASSKLSVARSNLIRLNSMMAELEENDSLVRLARARQELDDAGRRFERVLSEMVVDPGADKTWVTESVHEALTNLRRAKDMLDELESVSEEVD